MRDLQIIPVGLDSLSHRLYYFLHFHELHSLLVDLLIFRLQKFCVVLLDLHIDVLLGRFQFLTDLLQFLTVLVLFLLHGILEFRNLFILFIYLLFALDLAISDVILPEHFHGVHF